MDKPAKGTVRVTQIGSPIGRRKDQRQTLIGLGMNKMNRTKDLPDNPAVRGMIDKVHHLVDQPGRARHDRQGAPPRAGRRGDLRDGRGKD